MSKIQRTVLVGMACVCFSSGFQSAHGDTIEMTISLVVPPTHVISSGQFMPWAKDVEKVTDGRVKFRLLPKAVSGPAQQLDSVRQGVADVAFIAHGWTPGRFPMAKITEMPLLSSTAANGAVAYQRIYERYLEERFRKRSGVVTIAVYTNGPAHIYNTQKPIYNVADMKDMKFRVAAGGNAEIAKLLGVTAVPRPAPETYQLLSSGVVEGVYLPHDGACLYKIPEAAKYASVVPGGLFTASVAAVMNPKKYDALSESDKVAVKKLSGEAFARRAGKAWDKANERCVVYMKKQGVKLNTVKKEFLETVKVRTKSYVSKWINSANKNGFDGAKMLNELREEVRKLEAVQK